MLKFIAFFTMIVTISTYAELKLYLDFTLNSPSELIQLDEALKIGHELKQAINSLEADNPQTAELKDKLTRYEAEMLKVYGIYPGLNYKMVPTSGYIYNLIPVSQRETYIEKGFKIPANTAEVIIKNSKGDDVNCLKIKIKLLQKRESVIQFNQAYMTSNSLKQQINNLESQLAKKPELKQKEDIQAGMIKLKEALKSIQVKMDDRFGVRSDGKYIFEPKTGAVYLALNKSDLKSLSDHNQARKQ